MASTDDPAAGEPLPATRLRAPLLILGAAVFFLHLLVTGGHLMSPDEELLYRMAESMATRGSSQIVPLEADLATGALPEGTPPGMTFATRAGKFDGVFYAQYLPLQPALAVPFVWLAQATEGALAAPFAARMWPSMTMGYLSGLMAVDHERAVFRRGLLVMIFNPLVGALCAVVLARLGRLLTGSRSAGIAAGAAWAFGTIAWPHARTFFTEPLAGLFALVAMDQVIRWHLDRSGRGWRHALAAGVALALGNWTRVDAPLIVLGMIPAMGVLAMWRWLRGEVYGAGSAATPIAQAVAAGGIALGGWLLLQGFNGLRFGVDLTSGYGDQSEGVKFTTPLLVGLHGLLFSPGKGLFFFSPALVLGVWGWCRIPAAYRWIRNLAIASYLPFFLGMAMWQNWDGGWCWGPRHIVQIGPPIMLGAVFLFWGPVSFAARISRSAILAVAVFVQIYGSTQNPLDYYREYFSTYRDGTYHRVNLTPNQLASISDHFLLIAMDSERRPIGETDPRAFPAPMIDSIYLPQHTQWASYAEMWRLGYCDWFFLNALRGGRPIDAEESP